MHLLLCLCIHTNEKSSYITRLVSGSLVPLSMYVNHATLWFWNKHWGPALIRAKLWWWFTFYTFLCEGIYIYIQLCQWPENVTITKQKQNLTKQMQKKILLSFCDCNIFLLHFAVASVLCVFIFASFLCSWCLAVCACLTIVVGAGKSAGAFGDDQQSEQTANLLKTILWLIGQGPVSVNRIFLIIWVLNHRPKSYPVVCLSVIPITFIQGVLISQRGEERLAVSQPRWSKRSPLSASLEERSMWEQIHVEDVSVGHCCDVPCVVEELRPDGWSSSWWWVFTGLRSVVKAAVCQGHPRVWTLLGWLCWTGYWMTEELDWIHSPPLYPTCHLFLPIKSVYLESLNYHFLLTTDPLMSQRFLTGDSRKVWPLMGTYTAQ